MFVLKLVEGRAKGRQLIGVRNFKPKTREPSLAAIFSLTIADCCYGDNDVASSQMT